MRLLKNKVARANEIINKLPKITNNDRDPEIPLDLIKKEDPNDHQVKQKVNKSVEKTPKPPAKKAPKEPKIERVATSQSSSANSSKNIVKNYGRAISAFILSDISMPYLEPMVKREGVKLEDLRNFISTGKESIDGISSFRGLLLMREGEDKKIKSFKRILGEMSVVFIKYFSVNWIFSSKLRNKIAHLKCRFKMLRRVLDPEHFTYLKTSN